ncbi:sporulation protein YpjB [Pseudogracilibacillus auburnensis]|nr:sporulation protein YpjB [Pseudogracilibacillus auburnensis]
MLFICTLVIGVIIILFSLIQLNHAYANVGQREEHYSIIIVPFYWLILIIGGIIMITLSYVSWRKYRGDKKRKKKQKPNN